MADLFLVRNHSEKCPHRHSGPRFLNCKCNLGVDGEIKGKRYRRSLFTRSLDKAYRKLAALERPDYRQPKPLKEAIDAFKAAKKDVGHGTKRNHRRVLDNFLAIAKTANIARLDDVEIETIDLFRAKRPISAMTWTKELAILRNFFSFCVSRKWTYSNPAKEVKPRRRSSQGQRSPIPRKKSLKFFWRVINSAEHLTNGAEHKAWSCCFVTLAFGSVMSSRSPATG